MTPAALEAEIRDLYREHGASLLRYAALLTRVPESAPDAVQEAFLRYFVERNYGRAIEHPRAWLFRVIRNHILDSMKSAEWRREVDSCDVEHLADHENDLDLMIDRGQLAQEIGSALSGRERECIALRNQGLSYEEIGEVLGLRCGTVGALITRAYKKIRQHLHGSGPVSPLHLASAVRLLLRGESV